MSTSTPPIPVPRKVVPADRSEVKSDAKNRALRTMLQNLAIDMLVAIATVGYGILTAEDFTWTVLGLAIAKTALATLFSYVMRVKLGDTLIKPSENEPVIFKVGEHEMVLQRPGKADHAAKKEGAVT